MSFNQFLTESEKRQRKALEALRGYAGQRMLDDPTGFPTPVEYSTRIKDSIHKFIKEMKLNLAGIYRRDVLGDTYVKGISRDAPNFVFPKSHRAGSGGIKNYFKLGLKSLLKTDLGMNKLHVYPREYATADKVDTKKDIPLYVSEGILDIIEEELVRRPDMSNEDIVFFLLKQPTSAFKASTKEHVVPADAIYNAAVSRLDNKHYEDMVSSIEANKGIIKDEELQPLEEQIRKYFEMNYRQLLRLVLSPVVFVTKKEDNSIKGKIKIGNTVLDINKETPDFKRPFQRYKHAGIVVYRLSDGEKVSYTSTWPDHFREMKKYPKYSSLVTSYIKGLR